MWAPLFQRLAETRGRTEPLEAANAANVLRVGTSGPTGRKGVPPLVCLFVFSKNGSLLQDREVLRMKLLVFRAKYVKVTWRTSL